MHPHARELVVIGFSINTWQPLFSAAVVTVSDDVAIEQDFTADPDTLHDAFRKLSAKGDSGRLLDGVSLACDMLAAKPEAARRIVGGGLSDDSDLTDMFPGVEFMGAPAEKITNSVSKELEATFSEGLWLNGLASGQYDELHSYEDGINVLGQMMLMDFGSPKQIGDVLKLSESATKSLLFRAYQTLREKLKTFI